MAQSYYEYHHAHGYGRDDHMADEIIARAARRLGEDTGRYIAQAAGLASHSVPMRSMSVRLPAGPGVRARMERALHEARQEVARRDCAISVVCSRCEVVYPDDDTGRGREYSVPTRIYEQRRGTRWVVVATEAA